MLELVLTSIAAIISKVIWDLYQRKKAKKSPVEMQKTAYSLTKGVMEELTLFRSEIGASRVYVSLLHNVSNFGLKGLHYEKITVVFERTDHLTSPTFGIIKDYPAFQFSPLIAALHEDGRHQRSYHDEPEGSESRVWMEQFAIQDEYMVPLCNSKGIIVGLVGALFHSSRPEWGADKWEELESLADHVKLSLEQVGESGGSGIISWK